MNTSSAKPLILMLSYSHIYDDPRVVPMGAALVNAGYRVQVIGLALHDGFPIQGMAQGMDIILTPLPYGRLVDLLRACGRLLRGDLREVASPPVRRANKFSALLFNLWALRLGLSLKPAAIHCHTHAPLPGAWLLARWHRVPLVYDSTESVPDYLDEFPNTLMNRLVRQIEAAVVRRAEVIITVGERLAASLRERGARDVEIIGSWKRLEEYQIAPDILQAERDKLGLAHNKLIIAYFGNLHPERSLQPLLEAVADMPDVELLISGKGLLENQVIKASENNLNIHWLGWIPLNRLPLYTRLADAVYYCLDPQVTHQAYYSTPNKLFEGFAAGCAIIARRDVGEIGEIVADTGSGVLLDEVTSATLKAAFKQLQSVEWLQALQQAAQAAGERYNWKIAEQKLQTLYQRLTSARRDEGLKSS